MLLSLLSSVLFSSSQQRRNWDRPMELQKCSIDVKSDLFTATTFIEMEFHNPNDQEIEGLYRFQLEPGQAITALQLDLFGKFREGSIEERWKAANAYNTIVGKKVDPALLQMDGYNSYSLRIYPVPAKSNRRITMTIQQILPSDGKQVLYHLPVFHKEQVKEFKVNAVVLCSAIVATVQGGLLKGQSFQQHSGFQQIRWEANNITWQKPLQFSIPFAKSAVCLKKENNEKSFAVRHLPPFSRTKAIEPKSIAIFWDASFSGSKRDTEKEISFLKQYISYYDINDIYITLFNYRQGATVHFSNNNWINYLRSVAYEGATRFGALDFTGVQADVLFLVSDGFSSMGTSLPKNKSQVVYCVHASNMADNQTLNNIIGESGGKNIDLKTQSIRQAISLAGSTEMILLGIRPASGKTIIEVEEYDRHTGSSFVWGTTKADSDTLFFEYGNNGEASIIEQVVLSPSNNCSSSGMNRFKALAEFDKLLKKASWHELLLFGKAEKIVTYNTSFIVLEKAEDYVKFNIEPPIELNEQCEQIQPGFLLRNKNQNQNERLRLSHQLDQFEILTSVANRYNTRIGRWGSTESITLNKPDITKTNIAVKEDKPTVSNANAGLPGNNAGFMGNASLEEVVVVGYGQARRKQLTGAVSVINGSDIFSSATSVEQVLNGRVPGMAITQNNSQFSPGSVSSIRIRGAATFGNSHPLFVLDGIPIGGDVDGRLNINDYVSVNDIEHIEVLKDAAATAIYGSRGANGVIVIKTKKGRNNYWYNSPSRYKLSSMEDVSYLQEIKAVDKNDKLTKYKELQLFHQDDAAFYLDMAHHLYEQGFKKEARTVLTTAAEVLPNNLTIQKIIASFFEQWGNWDEAVALYEEILNASPSNTMAYRDLGLAYHQSGKHQKAIEVLYKGIQYNHHANEYWYVSQKEMLLNELNAIVAIHQERLDLKTIPAELLKPLAVDLRIVIQCSNGQLYGATLVEPDGKECKEWQGATKNGGYFTQAHYNEKTKEYQIKDAPKGRYRIRVNYYESYNSNKQPGVIKLIVYKNFGKPNQTVSVENVMMDNQMGDIEIAAVNFE